MRLFTASTFPELALAAPGFVDGARFFSMVLFGLVGILWLCGGFVLWFFEKHAHSRSWGVRFLRWSSVLVPLGMAALVMLPILLSGPNFFGVFFQLGAVASGACGLGFGLLHGAAGLLGSERAKKLLYRSALLILAVLPLAPVSIVGWCLMDVQRQNLQAEKIRAGVKPELESCCKGTAVDCVRAANRFGEIHRLRQYAGREDDLRLKYLGQACRRGHKESCDQFYYRTGNKKFRKSPLYLANCDVRDAEPPVEPVDAEEGAFE